MRYSKNIHAKIQQRRKGRSNLNMFFTFVAMIIIWRGVWHLLDAYFIPQYYFWNAVIPMVLGIVYLLLDDRKMKELIK